MGWFVDLLLVWFLLSLSYLLCSFPHPPFLYSSSSSFTSPPETHLSYYFLTIDINTALGAVGLPAYAFKGVYEEIKGKHLRYSLHAKGDKEWERMGREEREDVIGKWDVLVRGRSGSKSRRYA